MSAAPRSTRAKKAKAPVLTLVKPKPKLRVDLIGCLQEMLGNALRGELVGLAFAAQYSDGKYEVDAAGDAYTHPTLSCGMATQLVQYLGRLDMEGTP